MLVWKRDGLEWEDYCLVLVLLLGDFRLIYRVFGFSVFVCRGNDVWEGYGEVVRSFFG